MAAMTNTMATPPTRIHIAVSLVEADMDNCPNCNENTWAGHEYPQVYDGVLFWVCVPCGLAVPRKFVSTHRSAKSKEYADKLNAARKTHLPRQD